MNIHDARTKLAAALAPVDDDDPTVLVNLVDAIDPPALMIGWGRPWMVPNTACLFDARIAVTAVAARLVPGAGVEALEQLVAYTITRLGADEHAWPIVDVDEPRVFTIAQTTYIGVRISIRLNLTVTT